MVVLKLKVIVRAEALMLLYEGTVLTFVRMYAALNVRVRIWSVERGDAEIGWAKAFKERLKERVYVEGAATLLLLVVSDM
jgi:hypothetical protein